jgi:hypothetical protein
VYVATGSFRALRFDTHGEEVSVLDGDLFVFSHKEVSRDLFIMFRSRISESLPRHPHGILLGFDRISDRIMLNFDRASVVSCGTAGLYGLGIQRSRLTMPGLMLFCFLELGVLLP